MNGKTITFQQLQELAARTGFRVAPPDHPVFSEGPSITLSSHMPKRSGQKAIVSLPHDSQSDSDSPTNNEE